MGLEYLQIWADMEELFQPYDDAQRGRLIMAMMAYAYRNEEPEFTGVEKFIWPVLRQHIDRCTQNVEAKKAAGSKGGKGTKSDKQAKAEASSAKQTEAEASKTKQTEADESESKQNAHTHNQYHTHTHNHNHNDEECNTRATSTAPADDIVEGIDGTDLSDAIKLNAEVDVLLRQYKLSEAVRDGLMDEIARHGLEKVRRVMQEAAESDTKGGLSLRFIRACLANDGKPKPSAHKDVMQRHNYTPEQYRAMVTDLDAEDDSGRPKGKDGDVMLRATKKDRKVTYSAAIVDFDEVDE